MFKRLTKDARKLETDSLDSVFGFYRFYVGEHEIIVINDGFLGLPLPLLAANAPADDVLALMQAHDLNTEFAIVPIGVVLIRTGDRLVLLDTGTGASGFARDMFGDYIGGLVPTLKLISISHGKPPLESDQTKVERIARIEARRAPHEDNTL